MRYSLHQEKGTCKKGLVQAKFTFQWHSGFLTGPRQALEGLVLQGTKEDEIPNPWKPVDGLRQPLEWFEQAAA